MYAGQRPKAWKTVRHYVHTYYIYFILTRRHCIPTRGKFATATVMYHYYMFVRLSRDEGPRRSQWWPCAHPQGQFVWQRTSLLGTGAQRVEADVCDRKTIFQRAPTLTEPPTPLPITFIVLWTVSNGRWQSTAPVVQRSAQFLNWIRKVRQEWGWGQVGFWTNRAANKNNPHLRRPKGIARCCGRITTIYASLGFLKINKWTVNGITTNTNRTHRC